MIGSGEQLKVELKQWEREFIKEYRRKPTKNDICARKDIYTKYLMYTKIQREESKKKKETENVLPIPTTFKEFKYNAEDQSTISPPPVSPPREPVCEESFLEGYFSFSERNSSRLSSGVPGRNIVQEHARKFILNFETETPIIENNDIDEKKDNIEISIGQTNPSQETNNTKLDENIVDEDYSQPLNDAMDIENIPEQIISANHFLFKPSKSFQGFQNEQLRDIRAALENPESLNVDPLSFDKPKLGKRKASFAVGSFEEPQKKRRKLDKTQTIHTEGFQWGESAFGSGKRENFVKINLKKGQKGSRRNRRPVKGSSKALRIDNTNSKEESSINLLEVLENNFGYTSFRNGQEDAIRRIIEGYSTLVCIPTGSGKSLIYQVPALLAPKGSIVLVISPLLSLINDQLKKLPSCLIGATINSSCSRKHINSVYDAIREQRINILFISPEKLLSNEFQYMFDSNNEQGLKVDIHFACIDEAHCISQWSHNFRPSYLRISSILQLNLDVRCILALSATCTTNTRNSICENLNITPENVILQSPVRNNLSLSVSSDKDKYTALLKLLKSQQYRNLSSIIIYCMFQQDTEHLASFLQSNQFDALPYHAGMSNASRKKVQNSFMNNQLRIVVATVAFGMGVDKSDVRAVIHFSMPRSVEAYVQEVGRAGRDNFPAYGHLLLNQDDMTRSYKLCFTDYIDRTTIKQLLICIFTPPKQEEDSDRLNSELSLPYNITLPLDKICENLDIKKEVIDTLLTYLQLPTSKVHSHFQLLSPTEQNTLLIQVDSIPDARELDQAINDSYSKMNSLQHTKVEKLFSIYRICRYAAFTRVEDILNKPMNQELESERDLDCQIERYFRENDSSYLEKTIQFPDWPILNPNLPVEQTKLQYLNADIQKMIDIEKENVKSGLIGARILHGISSPKYPSDRFFHYKFWGQYPNVDFFALERIINQTLASCINK